MDSYDGNLTREESHEDMQRRMKLWDKKLSHLDIEMLHYVILRASSLIIYRESEENK